MVEGSEGSEFTGGEGGEGGQFSAVEALALHVKALDTLQRFVATGVIF